MVILLTISSFVEWFNFLTTEHNQAARKWINSEKLKKNSNQIFMN